MGGYELNHCGGWIRTLSLWQVGTNLINVTTRQKPGGGLPSPDLAGGRVGRGIGKQVDVWFDRRVGRPSGLRL